MFLNPSRRQVGGLREILRSCRVRTTFIDRSSPVLAKGVRVARNDLRAKFRLPDRGLTIVARRRLFGGHAGGGTHERGLSGTREVGDCSRLGIKSCIIRIGRKVKGCLKVRALRVGKIRGSCLRVHCRNDSGLCIPMRRVRLIRGCINSRTGRPGVCGLNKGS